MGLPSPSLLLPKLPGAAAHWRLELFCKSADQLATLCTFFTANGITRVNIPNKQPEDDLLGTTQKLRSLGIDVCVHYSFKQQYKQTVEHSASRFSAFCSALPDDVDVLLVSGGGKKKKLDTVSALDIAASWPPTQGRAVRPTPAQPSPVPASSSVPHSPSHMPTSPASPLQLQLLPEKQQQQAPTHQVWGSLPGALRCPAAHTTVSMRMAAVTCPPPHTRHAPKLLCPPQASLPSQKLRPTMPGHPHVIACASNLPALAQSTPTASTQHPTATARPPARTFSVCFNPYLPEGQMGEERRRLVSKLRSGLVRAVWLQVGSDFDRLESQLAFLKDACTRVKTSAASPGSMASADEAGVQLFGSVFIPSKMLLAQMAFRPWNGVYLSKEYLSGVPAAEAITQSMLEVYSRHGVIPLVETAVKSAADLQHVRQLLAKGYGGGAAC
ncbi:MAG: hypothetical protein WDW38_007264 [Sanguina aurantia]